MRCWTLLGAALRRLWALDFSNSIFVAYFKQVVYMYMCTTSEAAQCFFHCLPSDFAFPCLICVYMCEIDRVCHLHYVGWIDLTVYQNLVFAKVTEVEGSIMVMHSFVTCDDLHWYICVESKKLSPSDKVLSAMPQIISSVDKSDVIHCTGCELLVLPREGITS